MKFQITREHLEHDDEQLRHTARVARAAILDFLDQLKRVENPTADPALDDADATTDTSPAAIRAWAAANGYRVGDRGRLPRDVVDAFMADQAQEVDS